jgi:hypothetical protein
MSTATATLAAWLFRTARARPTIPEPFKALAMAAVYDRHMVCGQGMQKIRTSPVVGRLPNLGENGLGCEPGPC